MYRIVHTFVVVFGCYYPAPNFAGERKQNSLPIAVIINNFYHKAPVSLSIECRAHYRGKFSADNFISGVLFLLHLNQMHTT